ncbi:mercury methylation ferredoxin HgcB [Acidobacteriota bacterium]
MVNVYETNTLEYRPELCIGCGMCQIVCPHRVFQKKGRKVDPVRKKSCMECGACQLNCVSDAISVDNGVGCAAAMIYSAVKGLDEPQCGCG